MEVSRVQGISPALLGRWQRAALEQAVPTSAERDEIRRLCAELKRVEIERDILKRVVTIGVLEPRYHSLILGQVRVYQYASSYLDAS